MRQTKDLVVGAETYVYYSTLRPDRLDTQFRASRNLFERRKTNELGGADRSAVYRIIM